ncbi:MAG TPA: hypothetical protein PLV25_06825, partial [Opitutales bacterium]|nr:hypothetical protein [Opitutales bacterium]
MNSSLNSFATKIQHTLQAIPGTITGLVFRMFNRHLHLQPQGPKDTITTAASSNSSRSMPTVAQNALAARQTTSERTLTPTQVEARLTMLAKDVHRANVAGIMARNGLCRIIDNPALYTGDERTRAAEILDRALTGKSTAIQYLPGQKVCDDRNNSMYFEKTEKELKAAVDKVNAEKTNIADAQTKAKNAAEQHQTKLSFLKANMLVKANAHNWLDALTTARNNLRSPGELGILAREF